MGTVEDIYQDIDTDIDVKDFRRAVDEKIEQMGGLADEETAAMLIAHEIEEGEQTIDWDSPLTLGDAFRMGRGIELLRHAPNKEDSLIITVFEDVVDMLEQSNFESPVIEEMDEFQSDLDAHLSGDEEIPDEGKVRLSQNINLWRGILRKELDNERRISISSRGLFDVEKAMESPKELFDQEVWDWLPKLPKEDLSEACRCLAVDSSTASVFLSLRAVEDCLRMWLESEEGEEVTGTAWGGVLREIEESYEDKHDKPAVLTNLDYLRMKRNEVNHPDKSPDWQEAEATLYIVRNTISEIYAQIH